MMDEPQKSRQCAVLGDVATGSMAAGAAAGKIVEEFVAARYVPAFLDRIRAAGIELSESFFAADWR